MRISLPAGDSSRLQLIVTPNLSNSKSILWKQNVSSHSSNKSGINRARCVWSGYEGQNGMRPEINTTQSR